jgi:hypothetical protein
VLKNIKGDWINLIELGIDDEDQEYILSFISNWGEKQKLIRVTHNANFRRNLLMINRGCEKTSSARGRNLSCRTLV